MFYYFGSDYHAIFFFPQYSGTEYVAPNRVRKIRQYSVVYASSDQLCVSFETCLIVRHLLSLKILITNSLSLNTYNNGFIGG